jgi:hypothetical protein
MVLGYLDAGTGSIILQAILGGIAGVAVAAKFYGRRILRALGVGRGDDQQQAMTGQPAEQEERPAR